MKSIIFLNYIEEQKIYEETIFSKSKMLAVC